MKKTVFSINLTYARKKKGWSRPEAAKIIGITLAKLESYEESRAEPSFDTLRSICNAYSIFDLYSFINNEHYFTQETPMKIDIKKRYQMLCGPVKIAVDALMGITT